MRKLKKLFMDVFGFSKTETNGILILILILFAVATLPRVYLNLFQPEITSDPEGFQAWVREIESSIEEKKQPIPRLAITPGKFNPNTSSVEHLIASGVPSTQARRIVSYREKGGSFYKKKDLLKIYGMNDSVYAVLESYIQLPEREEKKRDFESDFTSADREFFPEVYFDLNDATAEELQKIRGVGPVLSERIVKYRNLLDGFSDVTQLNEIYGLKSEVITEIIKHSTLDKRNGTLNINQADSLKTLAKHPYIDYNLARAILNYRTVHGEFDSLAQLKNIKVLDDSIYHKLAPYLSL